MAFRGYFTLSLFVVLLFWGPINHSWPAWLAIRIGYVILLPLAVSFLLRWVWSHWQPSDKLERILEKIITILICIALFALAVREALSKTHIGNTKTIQTRDGIEEVGDDIILQGPNWGNVIIMSALALIFLWFAVLKKGDKTSKSKKNDSKISAND